MATLTFTLPSGGYSPLSSAWGADPSIPTDGAYYLMKPYGLPPREAGLTYQDLDIAFVGKAGTATKRFGGRQRFILGDLMLIAASDSALETLKNSIIDACNVLARYSVSVPGGTTRTGCKLVLANPIDFDEFSTKRAMILQLVLRDLSGA